MIHTRQAILGCCTLFRYDCRRHRSKAFGGEGFFLRLCSLGALDAQLRAREASCDAVASTVVVPFVAFQDALVSSLVLSSLGALLACSDDVTEDDMNPD